MASFILGLVLLALLGGLILPGLVTHWFFALCMLLGLQWLVVCRAMRISVRLERMTKLIPQCHICVMQSGTGIWVTYIIMFVGYETWAYSQLPEAQLITFEAFAYMLFLVGVAGLAFGQCFLSQRFWRVVSLVSIFFLVHAWIVMPLVLRFGSSLSWSQVATVLLYSVPALPMFIGLFLYAWCCPEIWLANSTNDAEEPLNADA